MTDIRFDVFKGLRPRISPRLLPEGESQLARNVRLGSGALEPWRGLADEGSLSGSAVATIYRMRNGGEPFWLEFDSDVDVARGPVPDDDLERTYYTGLAEPRMTYLGIVEGTPAPADYRKLGIPAPGTAPTVTGEALPASTINGTVSSGGFSTNHLKADFTIADNLPANVNTWYMALTEGDGTPSDNGYEPEATTRTYRFTLPVGSELRVASVIDADTVTLEDANSGDYIAAAEDDARAGQTWWRTEDEGTTRGGYFRFYLPNGITVTMPDHGLEEGDVIRVSAISAPISISFTAPATIDNSSGHFFGWESDNGAGSADTNTWPAAPVAVGADSFYFAGARSYPWVDLWVDTDGSNSTSSFTIDGSFSWALIERDGVDYSAIVADRESRSYVYTYVSELDEEGPPSPPSEIVTVPTGGQATVSGFEAPPSDQRVIDRIRIYRANTGTEITDFQFVTEIEDPFADYSDTVDAIDLGEVLQTTTWDPPPSTLEGLVALPNGVLAGFFGKTLCFSEPNYPHAWPPEYRKAVDHDIVGLGVLPNGVAVLTVGPAYVAAGDHPASMSLRHFTSSQSCVSKRSIVSTIDSVIYASPDGLASIGAGGFQLLTESFMTKREWQSQFDPTTIQGFWHDSKYFGFLANGGFVFSQNDTSVGLTTLDTSIRCGYLDAEEDNLYLVFDGEGEAPAATANYYGDVFLQLAFKESDGATSGDDESTNEYDWTANGDAVVTGNTLRLDGSGDYLTFASTGHNWNFLHGGATYTLEFLIEGWPTKESNVIFDTADGGSAQDGATVILRSDGTVRFMHAKGELHDFVFDYTTDPLDVNTDGLNHLVIEVDYGDGTQTSGDKFRIGLNGTRIHKGGFTSFGISIANAHYDLQMGRIVASSVHDAEVELRGVRLWRNRRPYDLQANSSYTYEDDPASWPTSETATGVIPFEPRYYPVEETIGAGWVDAYHYCAFPRSFYLGDGEIISVNYVGPSHRDNTSYGLLFRSTDYGRTFPVSTRVVLGQDATYGTREFTLGRDPTTGRLICFYITQQDTTAETKDVMYITSTDNGATWSEPTSVWPAISFPYIHGGPYGTIIETSNGLMVPIYSVDLDAETSYAQVLFSSDGGETWGSPAIIYDTESVACSEPSIIALTENNLVALVRIDSAGLRNSYDVYKSTDGGSTWTYVERAETTFAESVALNSPISMLVLDESVITAFATRALDTLSIYYTITDKDEFFADPARAIDGTEEYILARAMLRAASVSVREYGYPYLLNVENTPYLFWYEGVGGQQVTRMFVRTLPTAEEETTASSAAIYSWANNEVTSLEATWRSGKIVMPYPCNLAAGRIVADAYPVTLTLYNERAVQVASREVQSDEVFRLPGGYLSSAYEVQLKLPPVDSDVTNPPVVRTVHLAETIEELLPG